jgi:RNA-splicing ligase RtcB
MATATRRVPSRSSSRGAPVSGSLGSGNHLRMTQHAGDQKRGRDVSNGAELY